MSEEQLRPSPREDLQVRFQTSLERITGDLFIPKVTEVMADTMTVIVGQWLKDWARQIDQTFPPDEDGLAYLVEEVNE